MQGRPLCPQFTHVAQHDDAPPAAARVGEHQRLERRAHGRRAGVVAFVQQVETAFRQMNGAARAAARRRFQARHRCGCGVDACAGLVNRGKHGEGIGYPMMPRYTHPEAEALSEHRGRHLAAVCIHHRGQQPHIRIRMKAEGNPAGDARFRGARFEQVEMVVVARQHCGAALDNAVEYLGFRLGHRLDAVKILDMHRRHRGDQRHMRPDHPGERRQFAGVAHAQLEHAIDRRTRQAGER